MEINPGREYDMPSPQPQQKEQFSREDMINAYMGGFEQADNYANENGAGPENWITEYLNSKTKPI